MLAGVGGWPKPGHWGQACTCAATLVRGSASANSLEPRKRGGRRGTNTSWAFFCIQCSENSCSLHCVCYQNILNSREAADQETTACLCWLVKAIIKHLLSVDPKLTGRAGQLLITNAYFHTALLLSLLMVWHANEYSGSFFFSFFSSTVLPPMLEPI